MALVETSLVAEQVAAVPAAMPPLGVGRHNRQGAISVLAGGSLVGNEGFQLDPVGQQIAPALGVGRLATAVSDEVELVLSGGVAPVGTEARAFGLAPSVLDGWVSRGRVGVRLMVPLDHPIQWSFSQDLGAVGTIHRRTDTTTVHTRSRSSEHVQIDRVVFADAGRVVPEAQWGTQVSVPVGTAAAAIGGVQLQTWPVFWGRAEAGETCIDYRIGEQCSRYDNIPTAPRGCGRSSPPPWGPPSRWGP